MTAPCSRRLGPDPWTPPGVDVIGFLLDDCGWDGSELDDIIRQRLYHTTLSGGLDPTVLTMDRPREDVLRKAVEELRAELQVSLQALHSVKDTYQQTCSLLQLEVERNRDLWEQLLQATQNLQQERSRSRGQMFLYQKERLHLYQASLLKAQLQRQLESALEDLDEPGASLLSEQQLRAAHWQLQERYNGDALNVRQRNNNLEKSLEMQIELHAGEALRYEEMDARVRSQLEDLRRVLDWELDRAAQREAGLLQELSRQQRSVYCQEERPPAAPRAPPDGGGATQRGGSFHLRNTRRLGAAAGVMVAGLVALRLMNKPGT